MGHSLVQLGEAVISFGGCSFGRVCSSELLIQKPSIVEANMLYDCKNNGNIIQMERRGVAMRFCTCLDLKASGENSWYSGPQCAVTTNVVENRPATTVEPASPNTISSEA